MLLSNVLKRSLNNVYLMFIYKLHIQNTKMNVATPKPTGEIKALLMY